MNTTTTPARRYAADVRPGHVLVTREGTAPRTVARVERYAEGVRFHFTDARADYAITPAQRVVFTAAKAVR